MKVKKTCGDLTLSLEVQSENWRIQQQVSESEAGVLWVEYALSTPQAEPVPHLIFTCDSPLNDIAGRWVPMSSLERHAQICGPWCGFEKSEVGVGAPVVTMYSQASRNRITLACSDALNAFGLRSYVHSEGRCITSQFEGFKNPDIPRDEYHLVIRIDRRDVRYEQALGDVARWWETLYSPCPVPAEAREPLYSTWYSYHQDIHADDVERECAQAVKYGMKAVIVDDGWQMEQADSGYAFCGDWEMCLKRFPDIVENVRRVHEMGLKYVLWFSLPWVGDKSKNYKRFEGKYLFHSNGMQCNALDPRFPEVREFLIDTYEKAMRNWNLDGFKLDFVDSFRFDETRDEGTDIAISQNYAGRDCKALTEGVNRLMIGIRQRIRAIRPDALLEFRQGYTGPAMRQYGNMFRAGDCPADHVNNRCRTIDIRLLAGKSATHSDMLLWGLKESAAVAARQCWAVLFSVPQISMRLEEIPEAHREMLRFFLDTWREYSDVLLDGELRASRPDMSYPIVSAVKDGRKVVAVYERGQVVIVSPEEKLKELLVVNASGEDGLVLELAAEPASVQCLNVLGKTIPVNAVGQGLGRVAVPDSGVVKIAF